MPESSFRKALRDDLPVIVAMLADDPLGKTREKPALPLDPHYSAAFDAMIADPNQLPLVMIIAGRIVGYLQVSFIPGLSRLGMWRGQIESVRVLEAARGQQLGERLILEAIRRCRDRGCGLVQLATDKDRPDALRFYERLGFVASHEGLKLRLD